MALNGLICAEVPLRIYSLTHSLHPYIGLQLPTVISSPRLRWNFQKANWNLFSSTLDKSIVTIPSKSISIEEAYRSLQGVIPRSRRPVYTPCLDEECKALLEQYEDSGNPDIADHLIESLDAARHIRWEENTANLNFTHSSRKCWNLIRRLGAAQQPPVQSRPSLSPNAVASHLVKGC